MTLGAYDKRHYDAFRGEANRILSVVTYLNPAWGNTDGGELVLYSDDQDRVGLKESGPALRHHCGVLK